MADVYIVHIIYNIFLRLLAKPLLRCKCLSKHWNRVISDPQFMKFRSRRMILLRSGLDLYTVDTVIQSNEIDHSTIKLRCMLENRGEKLIIGGTFNGIVLLVYSKDMFLFNPFTRAFKTVPTSPFRLSSRWGESFGFGYGTTPDDLKIVYLRDHKCNKICCDVFNLKHGAWTTPAELIGNYIICHFAGTFVNGFLYWNCHNLDRHTRLIVALDVKEMVFSEIQFPCSSPLDPLGTLHGRLCIVGSKEDNKYGIWVMNEHGFGRSWTQVYSLPLLPRIDYQFHHMCNLDEGKVVFLKVPNQLIIYDMLKNSYKEVFEVNNSTTLGDIRSALGDIQPRTAIEYVETFISPSDICS